MADLWTGIALPLVGSLFLLGWSSWPRDIDWQIDNHGLVCVSCTPHLSSALLQQGYRSCGEMQLIAVVQVQDVEASVQEAAIEQIHDLLLARAATAGKPATKSGGTPPAALEAASVLRVLLRRLPASGAVAQVW